MKKILTSIFLIFGMIVSVQAQLNENARLIKSKSPVVYNEIKTLASESWEGDHEMMVYTINKQSDAFAELGELLNTSNYDEKIMTKALMRWTKKVKGIDCSDYTMVVYEYKKQIKAKTQY